jgi:hypothetical protein
MRHVRRVFQASFRAHVGYGAVLSLSVLCIACPDGTSPMGDPSSPLPTPHPPRPCVIDEECAPGQRCCTGVCADVECCENGATGAPGRVCCGYVWHDASVADPPPRCAEQEVLDALCCTCKAGLNLRCYTAGDLAQIGQGPCAAGTATCLESQVPASARSVRRTRRATASTTTATASWTTCRSARAPRPAPRASPPAPRVRSGA